MVQVRVWVSIMLRVSILVTLGLVFGLEFSCVRASVCFMFMVRFRVKLGFRLELY